MIKEKKGTDLFFTRSTKLLVLMEGDRYAKDGANSIAELPTSCVAARANRQVVFAAEQDYQCHK